MDKKNKTINLICEEFNQNLKILINNSNLPISVVYYIMKMTTEELEKTYYGVLNSEANMMIEKEEKVKEDSEQESKKKEEEKQEE